MATDSPADVEAAIEQLKQGVLFDTPKLSLTAFKVLFEAGAESVPLLLRELNRIDLTNIDRPEVATLVVSMTTILHDLSETDAKTYMEQVPLAKCHPVVAAGFKRVLQFSTSQFRRTRVGNVELFEQKAIDPRYKASRHVRKWLETVEPRHLEGLTRIYIIEAEASHDFNGYYLAHVEVITISWYTDLHPLIPLQWLFRFAHESTLYHEIGHHSLRHHEPGQDPEQEQEADKFASEQMRRSHQYLNAIFRVFVTPVARVWRLLRPSKTPDAP